MTVLRHWLSAKVCNFGLWILGYSYKEMRGLECMLGHVKEYRE